MGVCRPILQIQTLFQTKKCHFSHPFSDLASKTHTHSQTWPLRIMSSLLRLEQQQNWNLHISLSSHLKLKQKIRSYTPLVPLKPYMYPIPDSKWANSLPVLRPKWCKSLPFRVVHTCMSYRGEYLPPGGGGRLDILVTVILFPFSY